MDLGFEQRIINSPTFGASILWSFVSQYAKATPDASGADLPLLHIVLPLALHKRTASALEGSRFSGGLLRALDRVPDLTAQLSERIEDLSPVTRASLNLATASGLLHTESTRSSWPVLLPGRETLPVELRPSEPHLKAIHATARRLGQWTAQESRKAVWAYLDVRF